MARTPFPWRRGSRGWYVKINRKQVYLGRDRDQAFALYHRIMGEQGRASPVVGRYDVAQLCDEFMDARETRHKPTTAAYYRTYLQSFIRFVGGHKQAESIIVHDLTRWVSANRRWNPTTQSQVISVVQAVYRWAERQGIITRNPIAGAERPTKLTRTLFLTDEQQVDLLNLSNERKPFRDIVATMLFTGCRPQEARLVETSNVREDHWLWHWDAGTAPKGLKERTVFLVGEAQEITQRRMAGEGKILRNLRGDPWTADGLHSLFYRYGQKLKIKGLKPYTLRHTYVTNALRNQANPEFLRVLIGHSSMAMISKHYSHVDQCAAEMKQAAVAAVSRLGA